MSGFSKDIWTIFAFWKRKLLLLFQILTSRNLLEPTKIIHPFVFLPDNDLLTGMDCKNLPHVNTYQIL